MNTRIKSPIRASVAQLFFPVYLQNQFWSLQKSIIVSRHFFYSSKKSHEWKVLFVYSWLNYFSFFIYKTSFEAYKRVLSFRDIPFTLL